MPTRYLEPLSSPSYVAGLCSVPADYNTAITVLLNLPREITLHQQTCPQEFVSVESFENQSN